MLGSRLVTIVLGTGYRFSNPEARDLVSRFTPLPDARKARIDAVFTGLKTSGILAVTDVLKINAAHDAEAAQQNWVANRYHSTWINAPQFSTDVGVTGDGATIWYDNNFNPATAEAPNFTRNSASHFIWSTTNSNNAGGSSGDAGSLSTQISRQAAVSGQALGRANTGVGILIGPGAYPGMCGWSRTGASVWESYGQGADIGGGTDASVDPTNATMRGLSVNSALWGVNTLEAQFIGGGLAAGQVAALAAVVAAYRSNLHADFD
jgi:hypothetical protein